MLNNTIVKLLILCESIKILDFGLSDPTRRRIKTEVKAKLVAAVWGEESIQFIAALAVLHWMI